MTMQSEPSHPRPDASPDDDAVSRPDDASRRSLDAEPRVVEAEPRVVEVVMAEVVRRRAAGEPLSDDEVLSQNPALRHRLGEMLRKLGTVQRAVERADRELTAIRIPGYLLLDEIARGGQACVYRALATPTDSDPFAAETPAADAPRPAFAVKVMHGGPLARPAHRERFAREAATLAALDHPLIPKLHASGVLPDGTAYLVTDLVDGRPFAPELLTTVPLHERVAMFAGVCRTLAAAHARGIVHRDLKPTNILLRQDGTCVLIDFGMADAAGDVARTQLTVTGQFVGTYLWASPEQLRGDPDLTPASDVYALGVLLHQVTSNGAFPPAVFEQLKRMLAPSSPVPPASGSPTPASSPAAPALPLIEDVRLAEILGRCLAADPTHRYPDAGALADELTRYLTSPHTFSASPTRSFPRGGGAGLLLCAGLGLLAATLLAAWSAGLGGGDVSAGDGHTGDVLRREPLTGNANGRPPLASRLAALDMVWLPPGEFVMGSPPEESFRNQDEAPRRVRIARGFYMMRTEVRQSLYETVMGTNPTPERDRRPDAPVTRVSWYDAVEFCRRASVTDGRTYRLPTEEEWEYACRAGTQTPFSWGRNPSLMLRYGNFADRSNTTDPLPVREDYNDGFPRLAPNYTYLPNAWSLFDLHGNVWEWTATPYAPDPTTQTPTSQTSTPPTPTTHPSDVMYPARGGSWWDGFPAHRAANRNPLPPDTKTTTLGFRVVADDPEPTPDLRQIPR